MSKLIPIDVLGHADYAGRLRKKKDCPGLALFGVQIDKIRDANPEGTLLLDAGDNFCAKFWPGLPVVEALSVIGTDVMTLGNHEFDYGQEFLEDCIAHAGYPILCANITEKATGDLVKGVKPWVMLERQGIKIGVLGLTTEYTPYMVTAPMFAPYEAHPCVPLCRQYIPEMRAAGAQIVIVLSHFPFYIDDDGNISGELYDVLANIPPVDVFIGGHIPGDYAGTVLGAAVLKGGFSGVSLPHARLWFDPERNEVVRKECRVYQTDMNAEVKEEYKAYADKVTAPFNEFFDTVLGIAEEEWVLHLSEETKLGNFLADCMLEAAGTQFAYMTATSAYGSIEPGPVTAEDLTSVCGFNDPIYTAEITGRQLWDLFEKVFDPEVYGNNAGLLYSGFIVHADHTKPAYSKIQAITLRDGTPLEMDGKYSVASSEYMASGGNGTAQIANALTWKKTDTLVWDAMFAYLRKYGRMRISPEQRMYEIGRPENNNAPF
jgi:2',3'-cyclic-nucleotide 2'-phosphodiesterase (5'-nucleotidase family)